MSFLSRLFGGSARSSYRAGMRAFEAGQDAEALGCFRAALAAGSPRGDPIAHLAGFYAAEAAQRLGTTALAQGQAALAWEYFRQALSWQPRSPNLLEHAAAACLECGNLAESRACAQALLALEPTRREAQLLLAAVQHALGEEDAAAARLESVRARLAEGPLTPLVHRALLRRAAMFPHLAALLGAVVPSSYSSRL